LEGNKKIKVVIKDMANNEVFKEEVVNFKPIERSIIITREKPESSWIILFSLIIFVILIIIIVLILRIEKAHSRIQEIRWLDFKEKYKDRFDEFIKTMKEEIKNLDQDSRFSEEERNIYRKFKEIIERAEKEFEDYLKKEK